MSSPNNDPKPPKPKESNSKFFGIFLILSSLTCLSLWLIYDVIPLLEEKNRPVLVKHKKPKKISALQKLWEKDILEMYKNNIFHKEIYSLKKIRVFMLDENLHSQFDNLKAPFRFGKDGNNLLEVSFMSHYSELDKQEKIVVQYNLTSKKSGEMFWEHSRTIAIPDELISK